MKIISDIRLYKSDVENIDGNGLPTAFGRKRLNATVRRIVMKLREHGFSLGGFDHLYLNFTGCAVENGMAPAKRSPDRHHPWYRYYDVEVSEEAFAGLGTDQWEFFALQLLEKLLIRFFATEEFDGPHIHACFFEAVTHGERMLMKFKEKKSSDRTAAIYLRYLDSGYCFPLLKVWDGEGKLVLEADLPETVDLSCLGEIQLSAKKVTVKPRKRAGEHEVKPMVFELNG